MKQHSYTYEEVVKILDDKKSVTELEASMSRTKRALHMLRYQARKFEKGEQNIPSKLLQKHFRRYFTNRGNMQLEEKEISIPANVLEATNQPTAEIASSSTDTCGQEMEDLTSKASEMFESLKAMMSDIAKLSAGHHAHDLKKQLENVIHEAEGLRAWKKDTEIELSQLREFRERAKKSNFGSMLRDSLPF